MPHNPRNRNCHYPPRKCICDVTSVLPEASPLAPALLAWVDAAPLDTTITVQSAWRAAEGHFEREGITELYPESAEAFVDILDYAAPLFDAERSIVLDTSQAASEGTIGVGEWRSDAEPSGGLTV